MSDYQINSINTTDNFNYWLEQPFLSPEAKERLKKADIWIVPETNFRNYDKPTFPFNTSQIFNFLKSESSEDCKFEICIDDKDYFELALHSDMTRLGRFAVTGIFLPILLSLLANYIYDQIKKGNISEKESKIEFEVTVIDSTISKRIRYEGDVKNFENVKQEFVKIWEETK